MGNAHSHTRVSGPQIPRGEAPSTWLPWVLLALKKRDLCDVPRCQLK